MNYCLCNCLALMQSERLKKNMCDITIQKNPIPTPPSAPPSLHVGTHNNTQIEGCMIFLRTTSIHNTNNKKVSLLIHLKGQINCT